MRNTVSVCIDATQFGVAVVFLLLVAKNTHDALMVFTGVNVNFCWVILAVAVGLWPLTLLKSPQDFW